MSPPFFLELILKNGIIITKLYMECLKIRWSVKDGLYSLLHGYSRYILNMVHQSAKHNECTCKLRQMGVFLG